jgi:spore coat assemly protein
MWTQGDLVSRKSYGGDVIFRIEDLERERVILKGVEFRLLADAKPVDLTPVINPDSHLATEEARLRIKESATLLGNYRRLQRENRGPETENPPYFELPGKILHLDGDANYLRKSMQVYNELGIPAEGHYVHESMMADLVYQLLPASKPDILVITGHDGLLKSSKGIGDVTQINSYKNSQHFINGVKAARRYERNRDSLAVIAGACQSHFEGLLQAGANFASSPARILIHALDPVYIAAKMAFTSIKDTINIYDVIRHTVSGTDGLGGIETKGSFRIGLPKPNL